MKDFRVRYRNMSLGVGWSLANPLVMMTVLWFIFTKIYPSSEKNYPIFVLCGLIPYNFFTLAWVTSTTSLIDNATLIKRTRFPREVVPVTTVLGNCLHFIIQLGLLLVMVLVFGEGANRYWLWLPLIVALEILFTLGMALTFSALDVYVRDVRYVVESTNLVLFWLVPIFYSFSIVPKKYENVYHFNPIAAVVMAFRKILTENQPPPISILWKMALVSTVVFGLGVFVFERLKKRFYDYL